MRFLVSPAEGLEPRLVLLPCRLSSYSSSCRTLARSRSAAGEIGLSVCIHSQAPHSSEVTVSIFAAAAQCNCQEGLQGTRILLP